MNSESYQNHRMKDAYAFLKQQMRQFETFKELSDAVDALLEAVGKHFSADVVYLYKREQNEYKLKHRWGDSRETLPENWAFSRLQETAGEDACIWSAYPEQGTGRLAVLPLKDEELLFAMLVLQNPAQEETDMLEETSEILAGWLGSRLIRGDYKSRDHRVQKLLSGLGNDYTAVYTIDLDTDEFEIIINQNSNNAAKEKKREVFSKYLDNYADKYVLEESREDMKRVLRFTNLRQHFESHGDLYFRFHTIPNAIDQTYFEAHAVRQYEKERHFAVIGFRCVDALVRKEKEYQENLDRAYQNARQQLDIISSSIPGGIKISYDDPMYSFKYVSRQYAAMLGYESVEEFMKASKGNIVGIAHPDDVEHGIAEALKQYTKSDSYAITYRMRCRDGAWKYIEDHGHKVITADGEVEHWNLILDKNELVEKSIELESARKAEQVKTEFLSRMSHDIRTPLNGIIGLLEQGDRHPNDMKRLERNRKKARNAANQLLSMLNDVLELTKLEDKNMKLPEEPFNFIEMFERVREMMEMKASEESIHFLMDENYKTMPYPEVIGSSLHLRQIFLNIISNAIKYNKAGGTVWCEIQEKVLDSERVAFQVKVIDSGIGMRKEFIKSIYDPFVQEMHDARSEFSGNGIGMSIVKRLVDQMKGTIQISSQVNVGTTVEMMLPLRRVPDGEEISKKETEKEEKLDGLRALLVEDNELNLEIAKCMLEDKHISVTEARNGEAALKLFEKNPEGTFDVILMDIMMPVMDGLTAVRMIRKLDKKDAGAIPIFALTANTFAEDVEKSRAAGMNEHIGKPIDMNLLMRKIYQYCRGKNHKYPEASYKDGFLCDRKF